jgi:anti-sigma factor RsiW
MTEEQQLKLQAFLDGELPEKEARAAAAWVARDAEAADLLKELRQTRQAVAGFEAGVKVPESREFYWSKIERAIQRLEPTPRASQSVSFISWLRRLAVPASAVAVLAVAAMIAGGRFSRLAPGRGPAAEMAAAESGTFTYRDYANGTTLVWLTYPAESGLQ